MKSKFFLALLASTALFVSGCSADQASESQTMPTKIVFAGMSLDGTTEVMDSYALMVEVMEEELGIEVELQEASSAPAVIEALASGTANFGTLHGFGYVVAKSKYPEIELVATTLRKPGSEPGIYGYGVVRSDNDSINSLSDLKNKKVCYSNPTSLTTFMSPASEIAKLGFDGNPETTKDMVATFVGTGLNTAYAISNGDCEAGFMADSTFDFTLPATGDLNKEDFKIFWESERLPSSALVFGQGLPDSLKDMIKSLVNEKLNKTWLVESGKCTDEGNCLYLNSGNWGWTEVEDNFYDPIREMCTLVESANCSPTS